MNDFYQMNVFFFITSMAIIVLALLLAVMMIFFIKILNDIKYISGKAKKETDLISDDLAQLRANVRSGGFKFKYIVGFLSDIFKHRKK